MSTPRAPRPQKEPPIDPALQAELDRRAKALEGAVRAWLPAADDERSAEEQAATIAPLDTEVGATSIDDEIRASEEGFAKAFDEHVTATAKARGVKKADLAGDGKADEAGWLGEALSKERAAAIAALEARQRAAAALGALETKEGEDPPPEIATLRRDFAQRGDALAKAVKALDEAARAKVTAHWKKRAEHLATEGEERALAAVRERAEKAAVRRPGAKKDEDEDKRPPKDDRRRWYHWVIDAFLFGALAYLVYTRFIQKQPSAPTETPPASSASASASARATGVFVGPAEVRANAGMLFATVETLSAPTRVEVLSAPSAGWVKIKLPSGKEGFVSVDAIKTGPVAIASGSTIAVPSTSGAPSASAAAPAASASVAPSAAPRASASK
jgi:hypothetical protein